MIQTLTIYTDTHTNTYSYFFLSSWLEVCQLEGGDSNILQLYMRCRRMATGSRINQLCAPFRRRRRHLASTGVPRLTRIDQAETTFLTIQRLHIQERDSPTLYSIGFHDHERCCKRESLPILG